MASKMKNGLLLMYNRNSQLHTDLLTSVFQHNHSSFMIFHFMFPINIYMALISSVHINSQLSYINTLLNPLASVFEWCRIEVAWNLLCGARGLPAIWIPDCHALTCSG